MQPNPALGGLSVTTKASPTQSLALDNVGTNAAVAVATNSGKARAGSGSAAASAATPPKAASTAAAGKKGAKNPAAAAKNNQRRDMSLKWARRSLDGSI